MVVRPASTEEVAGVVSLCADAGVAVVPQGGNTGLVGGGVPDGGIVLSTERLNRIRAVDPLNRTMTVEAGCILSDLHRAADDAGALFPLSLAAEGSCRIGGNISTNAGGVQVLRYGNARDLVLGLEVVLPDGRVWNGLRALRKDNTGYDLKQIFMGAEGTLGVITAAVVKLFPKPVERETALAACPTLEGVLDVFMRTHAAAGDSLTAFEMMGRPGVDIAVRHIPGVTDPFGARHPYYALIELTSPRKNAGIKEVLECALAASMEDGHVSDGVIAASETQAQALWKIREAIPEAQKHEGGSIKHDVTLPLDRMHEFVNRGTELAEKEVPGVRVVNFGHLGDGNLHFNLCQPKGARWEDFINYRGAINRIIHDLACELGGSFSAEHGIGRLKVDDLERYKSAVELDLMRRIKAALDPNNVMNPGKVLRS